MSVREKLKRDRFIVINVYVHVYADAYERIFIIGIDIDMYINLHETLRHRPR